MSQVLEPRNFIQKKVIFTDVVSLRILRWRDHPGISILSTKANVTHLYRKYTREIRQTEEEEVIWLQRETWEWCSCKATSRGMPTAGTKNRRDKGKSSPRASRRNINASPWFQTSGLQNPNRIVFCCFKPPRLWYYVPQRQETKTGPLLPGGSRHLVAGCWSEVHWLPYPICAEWQERLLHLPPAWTTARLELPSEEL